MLKPTKKQKVCSPNKRAEELQPITKRRVIGEQFNSLNQSDHKSIVIGDKEQRPIREEESDSQLENKITCLLIRFKLDWHVLRCGEHLVRVKQIRA
jgi:hypothetical protein